MTSEEIQELFVRAQHLAEHHGQGSADERGLYEHVYHIEDVQIYVADIHPDDPWVKVLRSQAFLEVFVADAIVAKAHLIDHEWVDSGPRWFNSPRASMVLNLFRRTMVLDDLAGVVP